MPFRPLRSSLLAGALAALTLGAAAPAAIARSVGADPIAPRVNQVTMWGWVVVRQPNSAPYAPAAADHGSSFDSAAEVTRTGTGTYEVRIGGLSAESDPQGGVVHVTPIDPTPRLCRVKDWVATGSVDLRIDVACSLPNGTPADSRFAVSFLATSVQSGRLGYLRPSYPGGEPEWYYSFNSAAGTISVTRVGVGKYDVLLGDMDTDGGTAIVSSFASHRACRTRDWTDVPDGVKVRVRCYDRFGQLGDATFLLSFMDGLGLKGFGGDSVAYLSANQPTTAQYTPPAALRYSTEGGTPTVKRLGTGSYEVQLPNFGGGGAALVTATGAGSQRCQLGGLPLTGSPKIVKVRCFTPAGQAADSAFSLAFVQ